MLPTAILPDLGLPFLSIIMKITIHEMEKWMCHSFVESPLCPQKSCFRNIEMRVQPSHNYFVILIENCRPWLKPVWATEQGTVAWCSLLLNKCDCQVSISAMTLGQSFISCILFAHFVMLAALQYSVRTVLSSDRLVMTFKYVFEQSSYVFVVS